MVKEENELKSVEVDFKIREEYGLKDLENSTIKCADCGKKLLVVMKVKDTDQKQTIQCKCTCSGTSFKVKLEGRYYFDSIKGLAILDIVDGLFIMTEKK